MKRLLRDKRGMTLTEILVAITILMIVIVGVTPIMLSSYDSLYTAGEYTRDTYEAKSEIEDTLATRNSLNIYEAFKVNFEGLGEVAAINGKRAVSSLYGSLETIFTGGRAHVTIVSSKVINDDKHTHDVILQTTNITFKTKDDISCNTPSYVSNETRSVDVSVYIPDKTRTNLASIYASKTAGVTITKATPATGRIYVKIQGLDFTNSPAKIEVTYRDENNKVRKTSCYLTIKTPTIMLVGSTNYADYYTSAGVETFSNSNGSKTSKLIVDARQMDISGAAGTLDIPAGTIFKSVNWITEYSSGEDATTNEDIEFIDNTTYDPNYYVLTGTNGTIYRTYTFNDYNTGENAVLGKVDLSTSDEQFNDKNQKGQDVIKIQDQVYILDDAKATTVYPAVWGGDFSHIYAYSTFGTSMGYKGTDNWYTQSSRDSGVGQPGYYSNYANYGYYYSGWGMKFSYYTQNSKKISYILTELPNALRVGGVMADPGDFDGGHNRVWERPMQTKADNINEVESQSEVYKRIKAMRAWYYQSKHSMTSLSRSVILEGDGDITNYTDKAPNNLPTYFGDSSGKNRPDNGFAQLRIKALTTLSPTWMYRRVEVDGVDDDNQLSDVKFVHRVKTSEYKNEAKINITDAVYIPATATTQGGVFYVGTVAAYGLLHQTDAVATGANDAARIYNNSSDNTGGLTAYNVLGSDDGMSTTIYKYSTTGKGTLSGGTSGERGVLTNKLPLSGAGVKANSKDSHQFFVTRNGGVHTSQIFNDVFFTMGFASNREMVYSKIVYGKDKNGVLQESYKYYEPYYFQSHYDNENHDPNLYMNDNIGSKLLGECNSNPLFGSGSNSGDTDLSANPTWDYLNNADNDYYNVWFPGEMYNLTKVATKEGVTVAVGYAVSGSTYTWINPNQPTNSSTALGGIFNDGVLSAMILGHDTSFTNLLYFKDNASFDGKSFSDGSVPFYSGSTSYSSLVGIDYGTHARDSVQFTSVDISIESVASGNTEIATYYAYYADSKGRLYKSKIATRTTDKSASTKSTPQMISYISDKSEPNAAPSYMQEIKVNGNSLGTYFSKITTVRCAGDYIIVGGHSANGDHNLVIGKIQQSDDQLSNTVTWKVGKISNAALYQAEDILILDGYVYIAGVSVANPNFHKGFVCAMALDEINRTVNDGELPFDVNLFVGDDQLQDRIYSLDGHSAS